jgi:sterol 3beta-glucosyltransferase
MYLNEQLPELPPGYAIPVREFAVDPNLVATTSGQCGGRVPRMSIVIMIVGSRGLSFTRLED